MNNVHYAEISLEHFSYLLQYSFVLYVNSDINMCRLWQHWYRYRCSGTDPGNNNQLKKIDQVYNVLADEWVDMVIYIESAYMFLYICFIDINDISQ